MSETATLNPQPACGSWPAAAVRLKDVEAAIHSESYFTDAEALAPCIGMDDKTRGALGRLTFCVMVLHNGYVITGESACVNKDQFNERTGREYARTDALQKIWPLLGYVLKQAQHEQACAPLVPINKPL